MAYRKPLHGAVIDTNNPVAAGLTSCFLFTEGSGNAVDLITSPITIVSPTWQSAGQACGPWAMDGNLVSKLDWTTGAFSVAIWVRCLVLPGTSDYVKLFGRFVYISESNNQGWLIDCRASNDGGGNARKILSHVYRNNALANYAQNITSVAVVAGTDYFCVATSDGTNRCVYLNGVEVSKKTTNPTPVGASGASCFFNQGGSPGQMPLLQACTWDRCLTQEEVTKLQLDNLHFILPAGITTTPNIRWTQTALETAIEESAGHLRFTQGAVEVAVDERAGHLRYTQDCIEVVCNLHETKIIEGKGGVEAYALLDSEGTAEEI